MPNDRRLTRALVVAAAAVPRSVSDQSLIGSGVARPRGNHVWQVALYRAARGRRGGLLYVTDKRLAYFEIDDQEAEAALDDLRATALSR